MPKSFTCAEINHIWMLSPNIEMIMTGYTSVN